ncbi:MAG TPA: hypothetical protein VK960_00180 [Acidimicrobiia bacterium]|nr:hypothetical protein [Acidimicrobiia bacterium]
MSHPDIGEIRLAVPTRAVAPDRSRNRWPWVVGGAFAGLAVHASFAWGRSRLLAVAGCVVGFAVAKLLEWRLVRVATRTSARGRKALALTDSHLAVVAGRVIGGRPLRVVASVALDAIESIRVENVGRRWKRAVGFAAVAIVFVSEFVVISQNLILLGAIFGVIVIALVGVATTSDVWVRLADGRQWKFNVPASDWLHFYPYIPGIKWRGSGDGTRLEDEDTIIGIRSEA